MVHVTDSADPRIYTFGDLRSLSVRLGNALESLGVGRGDRVAIVAPQRPETAVAHLAVYRLGAVALPLSWLFGPEALAFRMADAGASVAVVDASVLDRLEAVWDQLPDLRTVLVLDHPTSSRGRIRSFDEVLAGGRDDGRPPESTSADDPALLIYTSGTTGPPKGALHAHRVLLGHLPGFDHAHEFPPHDADVSWTPADWAWIGGLLDALLPSWHHGIPVVAAAHRKFDPEWACRVMSDNGVRISFLPPTVLKVLRQSQVNSEDVRLRTVLCGGESLGEETLVWAREVLGTTVNEIYGQTEANLVVGNCSAAWPIRPGSMGRPYPGHDVAVLGAEGELLPPGDAGEVAVRAPDPVMFLEYWRRPDATAAKFRGDWLMTGDVARRDDDGYLFFEGRSDDIINSAGYRIGPSEIEECLIGHPSVAVAAAIGVPDEVRGQVVKAFIKLREGVARSSDLEDSIRRHVRERLAAYEYPRRIEFVDEIPMTTTGKIQRAELRQREAQRREPPGEPLGVPSPM